jgi:hypothetical protein
MSRGISFETPRPSLPVQTQMEGLVTHFVQEATDLRNLAAMTTGSVFYRFGRIGALAFAPHAGAIAPLLNIASHGMGLVSEVSAFEFMNRSLTQLRAHGRAPLQNRSPTDHPSPNLWNWSGPGGWREGLLSSAMSFGLLRFGGVAAQNQNWVVQHLLQDSAMVLGNQVISRAGWAPSPEGNLAQQFFHAEATNLELGAGMAMGHFFLPRIHALEHSLDLAAQSSPLFVRRESVGMTHPHLEPAFANSHDHSAPPLPPLRDTVHDLSLNPFWNTQGEGRGDGEGEGNEGTVEISLSDDQTMHLPAYLGPVSERTPASRRMRITRASGNTLILESLPDAERPRTVRFHAEPGHSFQAGEEVELIQGIGGGAGRRRGGLSSSIARHIMDLRSRDESVALDAARNLKEIVENQPDEVDSRITEALARALQHPHPEVAAMAALGLSRIAFEAPEVVGTNILPFVLEALNHPHSEVARSASNFFLGLAESDQGNLLTPAIARAMEESLGRTDEEQILTAISFFIAAVNLPPSQYPSVVNRLISFFSHPNRDVAAAASQALRNIIPYDPHGVDRGLIRAVVQTLEDFNRSLSSHQGLEQRQNEMAYQNDFLQTLRTTIRLRPQLIQPEDVGTLFTSLRLPNRWATEPLYELAIHRGDLISVNILRQLSENLRNEVVSENVWWYASVLEMAALHRPDLIDSSMVQSIREAYLRHLTSSASAGPLWAVFGIMVHHPEFIAGDTELRRMIWQMARHHTDGTIQNLSQLLASWLEDSEKLADRRSSTLTLLQGLEPHLDRRDQAIQLYEVLIQRLPPAERISLSRNLLNRNGAELLRNMVERIQSRALENMRFER